MKKNILALIILCTVTLIGQPTIIRPNPHYEYLEAGSKYKISFKKPDTGKVFILFAKADSSVDTTIKYQIGYSTAKEGTVEFIVPNYKGFIRLYLVENDLVVFESKKIRVIKPYQSPDLNKIRNSFLQKSEKK